MFIVLAVLQYILLSSSLEPNITVRHVNAKKQNSVSQKNFTSQATCTQIAAWLWIDSEVIQFLPFIA